MHRPFKLHLPMSHLARIFRFVYASEYPQRRLLFGYATYALLGTLLLMLPFCHTQSIPFVDQLFTAVSALSTTGLSIVDVSA